MKLLLIAILGVLLSCQGTKNSSGTTPSMLEGTWDLTYINGANEFNILYAGNKPFITFDVANNRVSGKTSCNNFSGALVAKDTTINFKGPLAMTKMFCPGEGEPLFTRELERVTSYKIEDSSLIFMTGGVMNMQFRKRAGK